MSVRNGCPLTAVAAPVKTSHDKQNDFIVFMPVNNGNMLKGSFFRIWSVCILFILPAHRSLGEGGFILSNSRSWAGFGRQPRTPNNKQIFNSDIHLYSLILAVTD